MNYVNVVEYFGRDGLSLKVFLRKRDIRGCFLKVVLLVGVIIEDKADRVVLIVL